MGGKLFITGAGGFIGKHLLKALSDWPNELVLLSRKSSNSSNNKINYVLGDITQPDTYSEVLLTCDIVIHIAGEKADEALMQKVNVGGMEALMQVLALKPSIKMLYISSGGVYGIAQQQQHMITEQSPCFPSNGYEKSKFEAEHLLISKAKDLQVNYCILRPSNVFGENDPGNKLLNLFRLMQQKRFVVIDHPANRLNYVSVHQLVNCILAVLKKQEFNGEIINVNTPCDTLSFVNHLNHIMGLTKSYVLIPSTFSFLLYPLALVFEILPKQYQYFSRSRYRELNNKKYYQVNRAEELFADACSQDALFKDLASLVSYYKSKSLL